MWVCVDVQDGVETTEDANEAFEEVDADGDGIVTREEFVVRAQTLAMRG